MAERLKELGADVKFSTTVKKILVEGGYTKAVVTDTGEEFRGRVVISNVNAIDTLTRLIDDTAINAEYQKKFATMEKSVSAFTLYLGLDVSAKSLGMLAPVLSVNPAYDHDEGFRRCLDGEYGHCNFALVDHSQLDPDLAPQGKSALSLMTFARFADWQALTQATYAARKKEVTQALISNLDKYLPGISAHIEYVEAATPKTMARYATLPEGAVYGFSQSVAQSSINRLPQKTKIRNLLLSGAWTTPGCGVHGCFVSGVDAADAALKLLK